MPGTVSEILVKDGDVVKADDELVILEAMKMENPICAPRDGKVKEGMSPRTASCGDTTWNPSSLKCNSILPSKARKSPG
ncbi:MAG: acetyl-CoA carboxylase biotin carboxyl carrier protein subunit [Deltaproteobacteria bacterium]|nr:acetyl-CoA carboxylase biotin carboxyl carrier protein subunit [Deltaproteobacteria bacterium]